MSTQSLNLQVIVGLGATGISCVRHLRQRGMQVAVTDTRENPPFLPALKETFPEVVVATGGIDETLLLQADRIIVSPGIPLQSPLIAKAIAQGKRIVGDIELFAEVVDAPIIAITGTNAKSTVTTLVGKMVEAAGLTVQVGGNLGTPALDLLLQPKAEVYVLELSSFQLETTHSLKAKVATLLNISPDHMDRYHNLDAYLAAKQRVYQSCEIAVCNRDDKLTEYDHPSLQNKFYFTTQQPKANEFGIITQDNKNFLAFGNHPLLSCAALPVAGKHYQANALAALAIGHGMGLPFEPMLAVLRTFKGLPHRCQFVGEHQGVKWYNDSKGTNVGATQAAIMGLGSDIVGKLILIAGGLGKNADFSPLIPIMQQYTRHVVLIGQAAETLAKVIGNQVPYSFAKSMEEAVAEAARSAHQGDCVLLSPACASFDMFKNFEHRGEVFSEIVLQITTKV